MAYVNDEPVKEIGGRRFRFGVLPADKAFDVLAVVTKNLGEPLAKMIGGVDFGALAAASEGGDPTAVAGALQKAGADDLLPQVVGLLGRNLNSGELKEAIRTLLSVVACLDQEGGGRCDMVHTFSGRIKDMLLVAIESFKVNFSDFFPASRSASSPVGTPK